VFKQDALPRYIYCHPWYSADAGYRFQFSAKTHWRLPSEYSYIRAGLRSLKACLVENTIAGMLFRNWDVAMAEAAKKG
jgi:hypothetical protein